MARGAGSPATRKTGAKARWRKGDRARRRRRRAWSEGASQTAVQGAPANEHHQPPRAPSDGSGGAGENARPLHATRNCRDPLHRPTPSSVPCAPPVQVAASRSPEAGQVPPRVLAERLRDHRLPACSTPARPPPALDADGARCAVRFPPTSGPEPALCRRRRRRSAVTAREPVPRRWQHGALATARVGNA